MSEPQPRAAARERNPAEEAVAASNLDRRWTWRTTLCQKRAGVKTILCRPSNDFSPPPSNNPCAQIQIVFTGKVLILITLVGSGVLIFLYVPFAGFVVTIDRISRTDC